MSRRTDRVASLIRDLVADGIRDELSDPRIEPMTSITRVEVSPDMSVAKIHVSVMAREAKRELTVEALQHAAGRLRSFIAPELSMRTAPRLMFYLDDSLRRSSQTMAAIDEALARTRAASGLPEEATAEEPVAEEEDGSTEAEADGESGSAGCGPSEEEA